MKGKFTIKIDIKGNKKEKHIEFPIREIDFVSIQTKNMPKIHKNKKKEIPRKQKNNLIEVE
jgi:hypothetical protein